ncbi:MAG: transcription antitermination factor NusB [Planctomycetota bacterium]
MTQPVRRRTRAREVALQFLYQFDLRREALDAGNLAETAERIREASGGDQEIASFALRLVQGTMSRRDDLDKHLRSVTRNWDLRRMATIDRNVLRMAIYEMTHCPDVPPKVAINEAIELAKKFSTANSGGFVNGILDRVRLDLVAEAEARSRPAGQQA